MVLLITGGILFTMFTMENNIPILGKSAVVYDETINVYTDIWYYTFVFSNGTYITFNWDNYTTSHLTLYTGTNYLLNITNVGTYEHGMKFTNTSNNGDVPFNFDIKPSATPYYDAVNFTFSGSYSVTCANYGNCGQHHAQMNFNVQVVDKPTALTSSSSNTSNNSGNLTTVTTTATVTDIIIVTSNVTQTQQNNVTAFQNVTQQSTLTEVSTQTQSLAGMSAIVTVIGSISLVPIYRHRKRKN